MLPSARRLDNRPQSGYDGGMKRLFLSCCIAWSVLGLTASGCRLSDKRTFVVEAPAVTNAACAQRVAQALSALDGVEMKTLVFDLEAGAVTVTYESMKLGKKNIEHAIARAGFDANTIPAPEAAKAALPEGCR